MGDIERVRRRPLILIVDEGDEARHWWELVLLGLHYTVVTTTDGHTALRLVKDMRPDLVLLDVMSPRIDALELLERLPRNVATPPPIVAVSDYSALEMGVLARGASAFLTKPVTTSDLIETIQEVLGSRIAHA
jgi:CheY-like chemotaxis protein